MASNPEIKKEGKKQGKVRSAIAQVATAVTSVPPAVLWIVIFAIALPTWIALIATAKRYENILKRRNLLQKPLEKMRNELAEVFEVDLLRHDSELAIQELLKLDKYIETAKNQLEKEKTAYIKLFQSTVKSSHGWQLFGRSLYYTSKGKKSWYDAEYFCRSRNAHLTSILSDEEQDFITSQLQGPTWIGLTDKNEKSEWEWIDGSSLVKQYWSAGAFNGSKSEGETEQYCTSVVPSVSLHNWSHANCHKQKGWMCKETLQDDEL